MINVLSLVYTDNVDNLLKSFGKLTFWSCNENLPCCAIKYIAVYGFLTCKPFEINSASNPTLFLKKKYIIFPFTA